MWTYALYLLRHYVVSRNPAKARDGSALIRLGDFSEFVFDVLRSHGMSFYDDEEDLRRDLNILDGLDFIELRGNLMILSADQQERLNGAVEALRNHPLRGQVPSLDEYFRRIESVTGLTA